MPRRRRDGDYAFLWGFDCPRCGRDTDVFVDDATDTYGWLCPRPDCRAVGFGFASRGAARRGLREYRDRHGSSGPGR
jgi:hypothetical protein